jgi:hypothetical protein
MKKPRQVPTAATNSTKTFEDLEEETICYFTDGSKICNQEFVGLSCVTASGEIRHQYWAIKFASIFT